MTNEEKDLLLKDLCARLPYGVITKNCKSNFDVPACLLPDVNGIKQLITEYDLKSYLRPMSSMTDEQRKEYDEWHLELESGRIKDWKNADYIDWLNAHHFDYRCLILMGLAIEAPEGMYKIY